MFEKSCLETKVQNTEYMIPSWKTAQNLKKKS
jgi:hypothetical protein